MKKKQGVPEWSKSVEDKRASRNSTQLSDKLVFCILGIHKLGLNRDMAKVVSLLFVSIEDLVLVAYKLDGLLVFVLLDGLCEGGVQNLATVRRDTRRVKAVEDLGWGDSFITRGTAAVFGAAGVFVGGGEHILLASDLCFGGDVDGAEETALLGVTKGLAILH